MLRPAGRRGPPHPPRRRWPYSRRRYVRSRACLLDDVPGDEPAHADRPVDVLIACACHVAACEVYGADGGALVCAVSVEAPEVEARGVRASGPLLGAPVALEVDERALR